MDEKSFIQRRTRTVYLCFVVFALPDFFGVICATRASEREIQSAAGSAGWKKVLFGANCEQTREGREEKERRVA